MDGLKTVIERMDELAKEDLQIAEQAREENEKRTKIVHFHKKSFEDAISKMQKPRRPTVHINEEAKVTIEYNQLAKIVVTVHGCDDYETIVLGDDYINWKADRCDQDQMLKNVVEFLRRY